MLWKFKRWWDKKADMAIWELVSIIIVIVVLALSVLFIFVLKEKGFEGALGTIKNLLRFGRPK